MLLSSQSIVRIAAAQFTDNISRPTVCIQLIDVDRTRRDKRREAKE